MSATKITLHIEKERGDSNYQSIHLEVGDKIVGYGHFGGEPEDNRRCRSYKWVEQFIKEICAATGVEFDTVMCEELE